ncbi:hypothetical protein N790_01810 [Arenimonas malthae CC-JY-1]|uniref:Uncharacterized protein n=1 Tax=Arenimonas malthae CC-JY-1 TaxID=1384054 RepID=A0A091BT18_9GAMM|nr:tetratricopeptide repeat protein [Arenimonas malthae]KFN47470.1 hypothetical protein N790_01810 [Arenimonas malthae CC-JY-1]
MGAQDQGIDYVQTSSSMAEERLMAVINGLGAMDDDSALAALQAVLRDAPELAGAHQLAAAIHAQRGDLEAAEAEFRAALALDPALSVARFQLGQLLIVKGDVDAAVQVLEPMALTAQQSPDADVLGAYAGAWLQAVQGQLEAAIREVDRGVAGPQMFPALTADMRKLRQAWFEALAEGDGPGPTVPLFLSGYNRQG